LWLRCFPSCRVRWACNRKGPGFQPRQSTSGEVSSMFSFLLAKDLEIVGNLEKPTTAGPKTHAIIIGGLMDRNGYAYLKYFLLDVTVPSCPPSDTSLSISLSGCWRARSARFRGRLRVQSARPWRCSFTWHIGGCVK